MEQRIKTIAALTAIITETAKAADLDSTKTQSRISMAKSVNGKEYGKIPALLNCLAGIVLFPAYDETEYSLIAERKLAMLKSKKCKLTPELETTLEYIKDSRGSHSFVDQDTLTIVPPCEPDLEDYTDAINYAAKLLGLSTVDHKLSLVNWNNQEARAHRKATDQLQELNDELAAHNLA